MLNLEAQIEDNDQKWQDLILQEITQTPNLNVGETYQQFYVRIKKELLEPIEMLIDKNLPIIMGPYKGLAPVNALMLVPHSCEVLLIKLIQQYGVRLNLNDDNLPSKESQEVSPIHLAAQRGKIHEINILLKAGADWFATTSSNIYLNVNSKRKARNYYTRINFNAFAYAANEGHDDIMLLLLDHDKKNGKGDLYQRSNCYGCKPLHLAIKSGNPQAVTLLLNYEIEKNIQSECESNYLLHVACEQGDLQIIQWLLDRGAASALTRTNRQGETPLQVATKQGHLDVVKLLVQNGATINVPQQSSNKHLNHYKHFTLLSYGFSSKNISLILYLIDKGADIFSPAGGQIKPLHEASKLGDITILQLLFAQGAERDIHSLTSKKEQPIHFAAAAGKVEAVDLLITKGASIHTKTQADQTVLYLAALSGDVPTCRLLLSKGANSYLNTISRHLGSPLHAAVRSGRLDAVQFFLDQNIDPLMLTDLGENCLHIAAQDGHIEILRLLLTTSLKSQINALSTSSCKPMTPIQIAIEKQDIDSLNELINAGADVHQVFKNRKTYLHLALESLTPIMQVSDRKLKMLQLLWPYMTDDEKYLTDKNEQNLLHIAADQFDVTAMAYLLNNGLDSLLTQKNLARFTPLDVLSKHKEYPLKRQLAVVDLLSLRVPATEKLIDKIEEILIFQFHRAIDRNNLKELKFILSKLPVTVIEKQINWRNQKGETPLFIAANLGYIEITHLLLESGAKVNEYVYYGRYSYDEFAYLTPFAISILKNHLYVAKLLYQVGASIKEAYYDATMLQKKKDTLSLNLDKIIIPQGIKVELAGSSVDSRKAFKKSEVHTINNWQHPPMTFFQDFEESDTSYQSEDEDQSDFYYKSVPLLHLALKNPTEIAMAEWLLSLGVSVNETDEAGFTALQRAIQKKHTGAIHFLIEHKADVNKAQAPTSSPLTMAISEPKIVEALLRAGADPNSPQNEADNQVPLLAALRGNYKDSLRLLLAHQADVHFVSENETTLMIAINKSKLKVVKWLLEAGVNIHAVDSLGRTALFHAIILNDIDKVALLLEQGAFVNQIALQGLTPLIFAARNGSKKIIEMLLARQANLHHLTNNQTNALIEAVKRNHFQVAELLIERGCHILQRDKKGASALFIAASNGNTSLVELLLRHGADPHATNKEGVTPLLIAAQCDSPPLALIKLLLERGVSTQIPAHLQHYHFDNVIYEAVKADNLTFLRELFNKGITLQKECQENDAYSNERKNFILMACKNNSLEMVELLNQHGADINQMTVSLENDSRMRKRTYKVTVSYSYGRPSYYDSDTNVYYPESVKEKREEEYLEKGERYKLTLRPIHVAVQNNNLKLVELLVKLGAHLNAPITRDDAVGPLHLALTLLFHDIAAFLIEKGANINQACEAIQRYSQQTRQYMGAPIYSFTPLIFAIIEDNKELVEILIRKGVNVNQSTCSDQKNTNQLNVLLLAAANNNFQLVNRLIMVGANLTLLSKNTEPLQAKKRSQQLEHRRLFSLYKTELFDSNLPIKTLNTTDDLLKHYTSYYLQHTYRYPSEELQILILLTLCHEAFTKQELTLTRERLQRACHIALDKLIDYYEFLLQGKLISDCSKEEVLFIGETILKMSKKQKEQFQKINFIMAFHILPSIEHFPDTYERMLISLSYLLAARDHLGAQGLRRQILNQLLKRSGLAIAETRDSKINPINFDLLQKIINDISSLKEKRKSQFSANSSMGRFGMFNHAQKEIKKLPVTKEYSSQDDMLRIEILKRHRRNSLS